MLVIDWLALQSLSCTFQCHLNCLGNPSVNIKTHTHKTTILTFQKITSA